MLTDDPDYHDEDDESHVDVPLSLLQSLLVIAFWYMQMIR